MGIKHTPEMQEKYNQFISFLTTEHLNISQIAKLIGVQRDTLYSWAKTDQFKSDIALANKGLWTLHLQMVKNATRSSAVGGEVQAQRLFYQHEEGWAESVKQQVSVSGDIGFDLSAWHKSKKVKNDA